MFFAHQPPSFGVYEHFTLNFSLHPPSGVGEQFFLFFQPHIQSSNEHLFYFPTNLSSKSTRQAPSPL